MIILYAKEPTGKFEKGDIIAFHSSLKGLQGELIEPDKSVFSEKTFQRLGVEKKKTKTLVLEDHSGVLDFYWQYKYDESKNKIVKKIIPELKISTDAKDTVSPYDGYPDIPADGKSEATIYVQKVLPGGTYCNKASDNETLYIQTNRGKLSDLKIQLEKGKGQFKLTSIPETILATVSIFDPNGKIKRGEIVIQFA